MGATPSSIMCNSNCGCTRSLPISSSGKTVQKFSINVVQDKEHARSHLINRPPHDSCLLISARVSSKLQSYLKSCTLITTFASDSPIAQIMNQSSKPSPILVFRVPPDVRDSGSCSILAQSILEENQLETIYTGSVRDRAIRVLFDSGASNCFISETMAKRLDLVIRPSEIKSVATAAGKDVPTLGSVTFQVKLGPALLDVKAHVLPAFLPSAHLIIGEDFMKSNNICIGYNPSRLVIHSGTRNEFTVERSQLCHIMPNGRSDVESNELPGLLTPSQAARLIRLNPLSAFVAVIKAIPIYPDSESQEAIQALSSHPDPT